jgi:hypothetical protein
LTLQKTYDIIKKLLNKHKIIYMQTQNNITTSTEKFQAAKLKSSWFNKTLAFSLLSFILGAAIAIPATSSYISSQAKKASAAKASLSPKPVVKKPQNVNLAKPPVQNAQPSQNTQLAVSSVAK